MLSKEDRKFINNLSHEMKTQDTRCTAQPYALVVRTKRTIWGVDKNYASKLGMIDSDDPNNYYKEEDFDKFIEDLEDYIDTESYKYEDFIKEVEEKEIDSFYALKLNSSFELPENFKFIGYEERMEADSTNGLYEGNFFLTEKSANEYIKRNKHNLCEPDTYGIHLYRNFEMEKLIEIIHKIAKNNDCSEDVIVEKLTQSPYEQKEYIEEDSHDW